MSEDVDQILERRGRDPTEAELAAIGAHLAAEYADPNSEINALRELVNRCCSALEIYGEKREIIGNYLNRAMWLARGDRELAMAPDPDEEKSNVVPLFPNATPKALNRKPHPQVIKMLEQTLEEARCGDVTALIMVKGWHDFSVQGGFGGVGRTASMIGEMEFLKQQIIETYNGEDGPGDDERFPSRA